MSTLALAPIKTNMQPKPTKTEIVTALATLHIEKCKKENEETIQKKEALGVKIHTLMIAWVKKDGLKTLVSSANKGYRYRNDAEITQVQLEIDFPMNPDNELTKLLHQYHNCRMLCVPDLKEACKYIRDCMDKRADTGVRVKQLLDNTESRKALDATLKAIA